MSEPRQLVWGQDARPDRLRAGSPPEASLGQRAPHWTYQASFTGSLGSCLWNWKLSLPPRGPRVFPWTTLPRTSPRHAEAECQGRTRDLGTGWGAGHGFATGGAGPGGPDPRPRMGSPVGSQACAPPGWLRALLWLKRPHPALRQQTLTQRLQPSSLR